jgi:hypothetical protein
MDIIISYNTYRKHAEKYNIKDKTKNGKPITYNKLKHRIDDYLNKKKNKTNNYDKHIPELSSKQQLHNYMIKYINGEINEQFLNKVMHRYVEN